MATKVHFLGIGGSGLSAVAHIAKAYGYIVSGCDIDESSPYLPKLKDSGITILPFGQGDHIQDVDIVAASPFYLFGHYQEVDDAKAAGKLINWQEFLGEQLMKDKYVIALSGTHGKSTTTALTGILLEHAELDPTVEVGATLKEWSTNFRVGQSKYFVCEADEFNDNFAHYYPDILVINNLEMDHPEYFGTIENIEAHFLRLVNRIKPNGHLIYNADHNGVRKLISQINRQDLTLHPYSLTDFPQDLKLNIPGDHNKLNVLGVLNIAKILNIPTPVTHAAISSFTGLSRRIELLGTTPTGAQVYDDYANHPTAFKASISGIKELHPDKNIIAVIEPHTFSRLKAVLGELPDSLKDASAVIVTKIFASREIDPGDFSGQDIAKAANHPNIKYIPEFEDVKTYISQNTTSSDIILVMGSGTSHKLALSLLK